MTKTTFNKYFSDLPDYYNQLDCIVRFIEEKSKVVNITAIRDYEEIWLKHIIDSLMIFKVDSVKKIFDSASKVGNTDYNFRAIDIGTGAGFPGLPLAVISPMVEFTLVDSTNKKIKVVNECVQHCEIENAKGVWARAEEISRDSQYKDGFNIAFARAVAYMPKLLEYMISFVKPGGLLVIYKSISETELSDSASIIEAKNLKLIESYEYCLSGEKNNGTPADVVQKIDRVIYVFQKQ